MDMTPAPPSAPKVPEPVSRVSIRTMEGDIKSISESGGLATGSTGEAGPSMKHMNISAVPQETPAFSVANKKGPWIWVLVGVLVLAVLFLLGFFVLPTLLP